jgi:hypothetical protein
MAKCTKAAFKQVSQLRTRYPWAVSGDEQIIVGVFNYAAEAKIFAKANGYIAFDASGVIFEEVTD